MFGDAHNFMVVHNNIGVALELVSQGRRRRRCDRGCGSRPQRPRREMDAPPNACNKSTQPTGLVTHEGRRSASVVVTQDTGVFNIFRQFK